MGRLKVFEGMPSPYDKMKKMVVPDALRVTRLKPGRRYCSLSRLATECGWKHAGLLEKLEEKRKKKSQLFYAKKVELNKKKAEALKSIEA